MLATVRTQRRAAGTVSALDRRRAALVRRLERRIAALAAERERVVAKRDDAQGRERLRDWGESLYTHAHEVPPGATRFMPPSRPDLAITLDPELDAKENAARFFARYRKLADALPHLEARLAAIAARLESFESLAWEASRADAAILGELEAGRRRARAPARLGGGRSQGKAQRTAADRPAVRSADLRRAFARAERRLDVPARPARRSLVSRAQHPGRARRPAPRRRHPAERRRGRARRRPGGPASKGAAGERVEVDYTQRKHVRKQRDAAPGLVWYTNFKTTVGRPGGLRASREQVGNGAAHFEESPAAPP